MAALYTVLRNTRSAIQMRIDSLSPTRDTTVGFAMRHDSAAAQRGPNDAIGAPRMYELGRAEYLRTEWSGATTRAQRIVIPISISYPDTPDWRDVCHDDLSTIATSLADNPLSVDGLALCVVDQSAVPTFSDSTVDDWFLMSAKLLTICEATNG